MKFAHMGDCHLGGWRQPELNELNFKSFQSAISRCINEKVEFIVISGDLFDSPYPSIDILKVAFYEFRKLKEEKIPVFLIAGSHDYSASGKTFLDVLEKAGFCKNVAVYEEKNGILFLQPTIYKNIALYGYPGKKSALEIEELENIKLQDSPGLFKVLLLHTAIKDAVNSPLIKSLDHRKIPAVDYLALSHLHINYCREGRAYSGPIFPNSLSELEELQGGSFYIFDNGEIKRIEIKLKDVIVISKEIKDGLRASEDIISALEKENLKDKIVVLKLYGSLEKGKISDIDFQKLESCAKKKGAFVFLKNISKLRSADLEIKMDILDYQNIEQQIIQKFEENNPGKFNILIQPLIKALQIEKLEDERSAIFEDKIISEAMKILSI